MKIAIMYNKSNNKEVRTFYWYFRPIAISSVIAGVLPLENVYYKNGSRLRFRFIKSIPHLYSVLIFWTTAYLLYRYSGLVLLTNRDDIGFIWRCVVLYLIIARSFLCFAYCTSHANKFTKLIKLLELFDVKKIDLLFVKENNGIKRLMVWSITPLIMGSFFLLTGCYELNKVAEGIFKETPMLPQDIFIASKIFGILAIWQIIPLLLYIYFVMIIKYNLLDIINIVKCNNMTYDFLENECTTKECIANTRYMYTITTTAVRKMSDIFGSFLAVDQFCLIAMFVVNIYVFFFTDKSDIHLLICTILQAVLVVCVINVSNKIKDLGTRILYLLERYPTFLQKKELFYEMQAFLIQAATHPIQISAADYFIMDRMQIPSIFSSVATYIIVLIQLSPQLGPPPNNNTNSTNVSVLYSNIN